MKNYLELLEDILETGTMCAHANGNRLSVFNKTLEFDMKDGFPLVTSKKINAHLPISEMLWFISGNKSTKDLYEASGSNIWAMWDLKETEGSHSAGSIGPMYGHLWRNWKVTHGDPNIDRPGVATDVLNKLTARTDDELQLVDAVKRKRATNIDQLYNLVNDIQDPRASTRLSMTAFNPDYSATRSKSPQANILAGNGCLNPCHHFVQCHVTMEGEQRVLSLSFSMTSSDAPVGLPFNIAGYATLLMLLARETNCLPGKLYYKGGDVHIYENQIDMVKEQISRKNELHTRPVLMITGSNDIFTIKADEIHVMDYNHHPFIKYPVS